MFRPWGPGVRGLKVLGLQCGVKTVQSFRVVSFLVRWSSVSGLFISLGTLNRAERVFAVWNAIGIGSREYIAFLRFSRQGSIRKYVDA